MKEQTPEGYVVSYTGYQGNITAEPSVAAFINRVDPKKTGSLKISKTVEGKGADPEQEFEFIVTVGEVTETFTLTIVMAVCIGLSTWGQVILPLLHVAASIQYPIQCSGSIIVSALVGRMFFAERLQKRVYIL